MSKRWKNLVSIKESANEGRTNVIIRIDNAATDNGKYSAWMFIFLRFLTSVSMPIAISR